MRTLQRIVLGLFIGLAPVAASAQDWLGGDGLPTQPLPCGTSAVAHAATPYDGAQPKGAGDLAGKDLRVIDVPKLIGIAYFNATARGVRDAADALGNVQVMTDGPTSASIDQQINFIDNAITSGVQGILFSANDGVALSPVLRKALDRGVHVVGYDADAEPDAREWFVLQAQPNGMGKALVESLAGSTGGKGNFAIITSTFTTPNQSRWIEEMHAYAAQCYPDLKLIDTVEGQEDTNLSFQQAQTLLNKYGEELDGIVALAAAGVPASAEAVSQAGLCGKVGVVGVSTPNAMRPYIQNGCAQSFVLWNPVDLGYVAMQAIRAAVDGTLKPGDTTFAAGRMGDLPIVNGSQILVGEPVTFDAANIDQFDF